MTVCIAALCDSGECCVLASDQMTTAHFPIGYEFESEEVGKIVEIGDSTYVLISGDVLFAHRVIETARQRIADSKASRIDELAEMVRLAYQHARRLYVIQTQLEPRGLDLNTYYQTQKNLLPGLVQIIDQALVGHHTAVDLVVAGKDSTGCHIHTIHNPGVVVCHDPVGFAAIGSGGPHAVYSLIESKYKKSLSREEVEKMVDQAKARSEVAPGVGEGTTKVSTSMESLDAE
jgi:20S proteasome alpha/beta subunit